MKDILDNLGRTIRSIFEEDRPSWDPDFKDAWQELNSFLDGEDISAKKPPRTPGPQSPSSTLIKDYRNLELEAGASLTEVKKAYKRLLSLYHPDRHADDPEKQRLATEITSRLNGSYQRIVDHLADHP